MSAISLLDRGLDEMAGNFLPSPELEPYVIEEARVMTAGRNTRLYEGQIAVGGAVGSFTLEVPKVIDDPIPLVVANGYCGDGSYEDLRHEVARQGKPAATVELKRKQAVPHMLDPRHLLHPELLPSMALGKVIRSLQDSHGFSGLDMAGHSWGAPVQCGNITYRPKGVRAFFPIAPAGMDGLHFADMVLHHLPLEMVREIIPYGLERTKAADIKSGLALMAHVLGNPVRTLLEGVAAARADIRPDLKIMQELGIKTLGVLYADDQFFHLDEILTHSGDLMADWAIHPNKRMGHLGPQKDPQTTARMLLGLIEDNF